MEQNSTKMTPNESFTVITDMINNLKEDYRGNAYTFILWGWIITLSCISHYFLLQILHHYEMFSHMGLFSLGNWVVYIAAGYIIMYSHFAKHKPRHKSFYERFMKILWQTAGLTMFVMTAICIKFEIYPPLLILPVTGMATLITGLTIRFKPVIAGGIIFFAATIIIAFWLYEYSLIVTAVSIILGYLIPGYMLKNSKSESHV